MPFSILGIEQKNKEIPSLGEGFNKSANMNVNIIMAYRNGIRKYAQTVIASFLLKHDSMGA